MDCRTCMRTVSGNSALVALLNAMEKFIGKNAMMAYLAMMAVRLVELHRVLKPTGSLYLHCDPTASHYLKLVLDAVFGPENYRNEIVWKRTSAHSDASKNLAVVHDIIFRYAKGPNTTWNPVYRPYDEDYIAEHFVHLDPDGRRFRRSDLVSPSIRPNLRYDFVASNGRTYKPHQNGWKVSLEVMKQLDRENRLFFPAKEDARLRKKLYLDESPGVTVTDVWDDLAPIHASAAERLGYPTQKPRALLERIIAASSNPGDVVLDPFCGCGTAVHVAQAMDRQWIGIDITVLSINLIEKRLRDAFPGIQFETVGLPADTESAQQLADSRPHDFQFWITDRIGGQAYQGGKKGMDRGIDGFVYFTGHDRATERAIVSVKAGRNVGPAMVRDLKGVMEREKAPMGIFVCAATPTAEMKREAAAADSYDAADGRSYPRVQIFTLEDLFAGRQPRVPLLDRQPSFKRAPREKADGQGGLLL